MWVLSEARENSGNLSFHDGRMASNVSASTTARNPRIHSLCGPKLGGRSF